MEVEMRKALWIAFCAAATVAMVVLNYYATCNWVGR